MSWKNRHDIRVMPARFLQHLRLKRARLMLTADSPLARARHLRALRYGRGLTIQPFPINVWARFLQLAGPL